MLAQVKHWTAIVGGFLFLLAAVSLHAQDPNRSDFRMLRASGMHALHEDAPVLDDRELPGSPLPSLNATARPPRMSPELALTAYLGLAQTQLTELGAYTDDTTIEADLPDTAQHGKYELRRSFHAPRTLAFAAGHFVGDNFVKTNVIARLLQSEVDHVQKGQGALTAITAENYKFSYKGIEILGDDIAYIYQVKPKHKRPGLFKGRILIDPSTAHLRRAEGSIVKSPSFFVKKLEFVQDYAEYGRFSLPVHAHSVAKTRVFGRAIVDIYHLRYEAKSLAEVQAESGTASGSAAGGSGSN